MKRFIIVLLLLACVAAVTYASLRTTKQKAATKTGNKEMKHHRCSHSCMST
ncbi:MAG TPA: hypothetical protein VK588_14535 [Chitinophagaceae bacterium]|nr:hypothetical protein [Chitinophagaceae bacterium]